APAAGEPIGQHDRIHRSRRRARHSFDLEAAVLEQLVEYPPSESAMGAAPLQRETDRLARPAPALAGRKRPPPRGSRLERIGKDVCEQNGKHSRRGRSGDELGGTCDMVAGLLHCNIYYGIAARAKYRQSD